jgi:cytochrome c oxidase subunit II
MNCGHRHCRGSRRCRLDVSADKKLGSIGANVEDFEICRDCARSQRAVQRSVCGVDPQHDEGGHRTQPRHSRPAYDDSVGLCRDRRSGVRRDDLFAGQIPAFTGRCRGPVRSQHQGGSDLDHHPHRDITVKVTGYQWKWNYDYLDQGVNFYSTLARTSNEARQLKSGIDPNSVDNYLLEVDHPLVVPVGKKVRILLTAADVIHAWWVPQFGMKKDAIPGYINQLWFRADVPGTYRGQCAELCGRDHAFMPVVVEVKSEEDFNTWLKAQQQNAQPTPQVASIQGAANTTLAKPE